MKVIITESQYNRAVDSYITYLLEPHEVKIGKDNQDSIFWITDRKDKPDSTFWIKDDKVIAKIRNSKFFNLDIDLWYDISRMFGLNFYETQSVIKDWLEQHYDLGELKPQMISRDSDSIGRLP